MPKILVVVALVLGIAQPSAVPAAAAKFLPEVTWRSESVLAADFSCHGRREQAILGVTPKEIVIAVFLNGLTKKPEVLRYSAEARDPNRAKLAIEDLDYDPKEPLGQDLPGFRRSRTCKGLNLSDGLIDSAHIFWNHNTKQFDDWVL